MLKFDLDKKWLEEEQEKVIKSVKHSLAASIDRQMYSVVGDMIRDAAKEELKKPEYRSKIEQLVKDLLADNEAKNLVGKTLGYIR